MLCMFVTPAVFAQERGVSHIVEKGETINQIAQKYKVTPFDIYQLNPAAKNGLKPNSVLIIPKKAGNQLKTVPAKQLTAAVPAKVNTVVKSSLLAKTHQVAPKETLYGIEKKYGVSDEALKSANPNLGKDGLQVGQTLVIPSKSPVKSFALVQDKVVYHEVLAKETKYSIAKQHGITIEELEKKNPSIATGLLIGSKLLIKGNAPKAEKVVAVASAEPKKEMMRSLVKATPVKTEYQNYEVKPRETLYGLSKMFGLTKDELIVLNPVLANGLVVGMALKVPSTTALPKEKEAKKEYAALIKKGTTRKKLALLLPFEVPKIEGDTVNSTAMRLKKDKFLNMTLDFYAGAMMAIDSAKQIGLPIDVKIFDSQETKNTSNVAAIIKDNDLVNADAVVGPFYQSNVEKTAELLAANQVPVISPLSKDLGKPYSNIYQTIPTVSAVKNAMFDYMRAKSGNIIAVVDKKKESARQYIQDNHKDVKFAALAVNGALSVESLKSLFVKDKINYVVLETGNTAMIKATMATMMSSLATYKLQLVILEQNPTLDTDEISLVNLTKLKLIYPSATRDNKSAGALLFEKNFKKKNKIAPSSFATRGFDLTFDTMMRLSQDKKYQETADTVATEQVDNKFEFYKKADGGYKNKGVYILYYDTDLTIKEAK
jgi:LysM repeat protein